MPMAKLLATDLWLLDDIPAMSHHFNHAELWESVCMTDTVSIDPERTFEFKTFPWRGALLTQFGHHIKNLTLYLEKDPPNEEMFSDLLSFQHWETVKSLVLKIADTENQPYRVFHQVIEGENNVYNLITTVREKNRNPDFKIYIDLVETAMHPDFYSGALKCFPEDPRCQSLRVLVMYPHVESYEQSLLFTEQRVSILVNEARATPELLSQFPALEEVALVSTSLSDYTVETLGGIKSLRSLTINFDPKDRDTHISREAWKDMVEACPRLEVSICCCQMRYFEMVICDEVPVVSLSIMYFPLTLCICMDGVVSFCIAHKDTLRKLVFVLHEDDAPNRSDYKRMDYVGELKVLSLVVGCPNLEELHFNGVIPLGHLIDIAKMRKPKEGEGEGEEQEAERWKALTFPFKGVIVPHEEHGPSEDDLAIEISKLLQRAWKFSSDIYEMSIHPRLRRAMEIGSGRKKETSDGSLVDSDLSTDDDEEVESEPE